VFISASEERVGNSYFTQRPSEVKLRSNTAGLAPRQYESAADEFLYYLGALPRGPIFNPHMLIK